MKLYVITNEDPFDVLIKKLEVVCQYECVSYIQYRRKTIHEEHHFTESSEILCLCEKTGKTLIINDNTVLAHKLNKETKTENTVGVHLGQSDGNIHDARQMLGKNAVIGSTCHDSLELAKKAKLADANYVAFGAYSPSRSKKNVSVLPEKFIREAKESLDIPVCVIGGIRVNDASELSQQGADYIAVISDVLSGTVEDVQESMAQWKYTLEGCF